jgi:hypothetical protein
LIDAPVLLTVNVAPSVIRDAYIPSIFYLPKNFQKGEANLRIAAFQRGIATFSEIYFGNRAVKEIL